MIEAPLAEISAAMSVPFYVPDVDDDEELMLGGPTGVPVAGTPGQPLIPGYPQRWVAVSGLTGNVVDANIRQPEPGKLVLCACINKYGCICYGYHDELEVWSRRMLIMAVVFAILTSPVVLVCFIPALSYMKQVTFSKRFKLACCEHVGERGCHKRYSHLYAAFRSVCDRDEGF